jgi:hypothetical protein
MLVEDLYGLGLSAGSRCTAGLDQLSSLGKPYHPQPNGPVIEVETKPSDEVMATIVKDRDNVIADDPKSDSTDWERHFKLI